MDYDLIDSGDGEKLERFGGYILSRPDPQALWRKHLPVTDWKKASGTFTRGEKNGDWSMKKDTPDRWNIVLADLKFWIRPTAFKHVGLFPEQATNWDWMRNKIKTAGVKDGKSKDGFDFEVLNLFGYTGGASLACAQAGAKVVHVDGSKVALTWARDNALLSGLDKKPIRWILDDARAFVKREIKRGRKYQGIIMDPPAFGHGPDNEVWKIEEDFMSLVEMCFSLLVDKTVDKNTKDCVSDGGLPLFFLINGYSAGYSAVAYENILKPLINRFGGSIEKGELLIKEQGSDGRSLPCGIFARWSA